MRERCFEAHATVSTKTRQGDPTRSPLSVGRHACAFGVRIVGGRFYVARIDRPRIDSATFDGICGRAAEMPAERDHYGEEDTHRPPALGAPVPARCRCCGSEFHNG